MGKIFSLRNEYHIIFLALISLPCNFNLLAKSISKKDNLREICRKKIAGLYLTTYDEKQKLETFLASLKKKLPALNKGLAESKSQLTTVKKLIQENDYSLERLEKKDLLTNRIQALEENLQTNQNLQNHYKEKLSTLSSQLKFIHDKINPIFEIKGNNKQSGKYSISIDYRFKCSKYHQYCLLPANQAKILKNILGEQETPLSCTRYASFLKG